MNIATVDEAGCPSLGQLTSTWSDRTGANGIASARAIVPAPSASSHREEDIRGLRFACFARKAVKEHDQSVHRGAERVPLSNAGTAERLGICPY
ncbi:hypothetical protein GCM10027360_15710 [Amycolatopsis echigonensis]